MCLFHLNMSIEGRVCRHSVTSSETSSAWEIFFMPMVFPFLMSNCSYIEQVKFFKKWRNFEVWANFFVKSVIGRKLSQPDSQEHSCILSFWSTFWLNNWRSYGNSKIWPIFWPGDLVPWPTFLSMLLTGTADPFHIWTNFGDHMSKRSRVMLDKTDRQTDKRTNEHTCQKILASNKPTNEHTCQKILASNNLLTTNGNLRKLLYVKITTSLISQMKWRIQYSDVIMSAMAS